LAVETARQIVAGGGSVAYLVLFDSWRPGYAAELAREQAGRPEMTLRARLYRKYRFHQNRWETLTNLQRLQYVSLAVRNKCSSLLSKLYLKNWAIAEWFCKRFGLPTPHFMHNVSLTTINSLKEYRGVEPYPGSMVLIRAKDAPYIPGAQEHCGWNAIVQGGVQVLWAPGDHESMFLPPRLHTVGEFLRQGLAEAHAQHSS
jgi:thioesterase domain-containing protein